MNLFFLTTFPVEGAASTIYAVTEPKTHQLFALKHVVRKAEKDIRYVDQVENEFNVSKLFRHPGLRRSVELKVSRRAVFRPIPGRRDSSVARSSIADIEPGLERQLEWKIEAAGHLAHVLLRGRLGFLLRVGDGDHHEILQHLDITRIHDAGIELDLLDLPGAVHVGRDHPATGGTRNGDLLKLFLHFLKAILHVLRLLQDLHEIGHGIGCKRLGAARPPLKSYRASRGAG